MPLKSQKYLRKGGFPFSFFFYYGVITVLFTIKLQQHRLRILIGREFTFAFER